MRTRLFSLVTLGGLTMTSLSAQVLFSEDFDGIGGPTAGGAGTYVFPSGWLLRNVDNGTPAAQVAYVNEAWERREDFRFNVGDSAAFSTSWIGPAGTVDDWMWTPPVTLTDNAVLRWRAVAYDPDFQDGYEVRLMAAPDVPTGGTGVLGNQVDASLLLTSVAAENSTWTDRSVDLADHAGQTVRIGFRNHSTDKFLLLIDDVVIERLLEVDAQMLAVDLPSRYTSTPLPQAAPITLQGTVRNNGTAALTDAAAQVDVLRDGTTVFSQSSTPQASLAPGASMDWTVPGYVPDAAGEYTVRYIARQASGIDQAPLNDTLYSAFTVSDSVYARDTGVLSGSLGIGAGNGGYLGQSFELVTADTLTSVLVAYSRGYVGRQAAVVIWDMAGGSPNAIVAGTDTVLYPSDEAFVAQLPIPDGGVLLPAGMYAVTAVEFDSTLALGLTTDIFTTGTTWVDWPSSPLPGWGHNEDFGAAFAKSYVLRPIFGHVCAGYTLQASSTPATCATCTDGSVTATVSGDHGEVTYAWDPAIGEGPSITDLAHGIYTVTATDALGCAASAQVAVAFDTCGVFTADLFTSAASCGTCPDGSAWVVVSGDNGGLTYQWSTSAVADSIGELLPGDYTVTVTDQFGCTAELSGTVDLSTGIGAVGEAGAMSVFPNPNNGRFRLHLGDVKGPVDALLVDASGATVWSAHWTAITDGVVDVSSGLAAGMYTLRVSSASSERTLGLVVTGR